MADLFSGALAPIVSPFQFGNHSVRVVVRNSEPWFVASDVCAALDYRNTSKAVADHLDADERSNQSLDRGGSLVIINESGLYALVLRSRKPQARKFAKWVTGEVLPSIRKTGGYGKPDADIKQAISTAVREAVAGLPALPAPLPRLSFPIPPRSDQYKFERQNPYPRGGRTIEMCKEIVGAIGCWAGELPDPQARGDLQDATKVLHELLVTGWTEVDEALSAIKQGVHFLHRWQGRSGRVGNVR
ncbi:MAG: Bro-N domain-containing protein [Burkholderiaceae bacterium]|jgi:hypothetical protein|nr:Bro-N domain-containing protein [Burkholderiaceae bacterium]